MPVPRAIIDQIKKLIPPLDGTLHKGQSGKLKPETATILHSYPEHCVVINRPCRRARRRVRVSGVSLRYFTHSLIGDIGVNSYTGAPFFAAMSALRFVQSSVN